MAPTVPTTIPALAPVERPFLDATVAGIAEDDGEAV